MSSLLRRILVGSPLPTHRARHERLNKILALPVFASDNLSSSAYATEEILFALLLAGTASFAYALPIAAAIACLLLIVTISYRQTVLAYPTGGGAYIVARENLGSRPATIAAAALLIDYVLTVSVSVAAGIAAIDSAFTVLRPWRVELCILAIVAIGLANLRGVRESGLLFALPSYSFVAAMLMLLGVGAYRIWNGMPPAEVVRQVAHEGGEPLTVFLLLRAFASGCAALTGVEAISNGVQAFKPPEGENAATTMLWMSALLATFFIGITWEVQAFRAVGSSILPVAGGETVVSQLARTVFGSSGFYYVVQATTAMILILAANTSFADFPRLGAILARDRFLPRQLANVGDRLVYNNGILVLITLSSVLVALFRGSTHLLIPLYAVGVFLSFTISQSGMVKHWYSRRTRGWKRSAFINGLGAVTTAIVLAVIAMEKFTHGAWMVIVLIPALVWLFEAIHAHYTWLRAELAINGDAIPPPRHNKVVVLAPGVHRGVLPALQFAQSISEDVQALHVEIDAEETPRVREQWEQWGLGVPLVVLDSPYRSLVEPVLTYIRDLDTLRPDDHIVVIIPEFVTRSPWRKLLHNHAGLLLKYHLMFQQNVIVANVRYWVDGSPSHLDGRKPKRGPLSGCAPCALGRENGLDSRGRSGIR
jgi:amino acid transporter